MAEIGLLTRRLFAVRLLPSYDGKMDNVRAQVEAGMEVVSWAWSVDEWAKYVDAQGPRFPSVSTDARIRKAGVAGAVFALLVGGRWCWVGCATEGIVIGAIAGAAFFTVAVMNFDAGEESQAIRQEEIRSHAPQVTLTTTGIAADAKTLLWRSAKSFLAEVGVVHQNGWPALKLRFAKRLLSLEVGLLEELVPLPSHLHDQADDLAASLREQMVPKPVRRGRYPQRGRELGVPRGSGERRL